MKLYELKASKSTAFWGAIDAPTGVDAITIAQRPDCSAFLVLSSENNAALTEVTSIPAGYDFTYCQEWGLAVTEDIIRRTKNDLIAKHPGRWPKMEAEQTRQELEDALDAYIDSVAKAKGYDSRITAALRASYPNPWQAEGIAFGTWMDSCYSTALTIMAEVQAGTRPIPTKDELIAAMPTMVWPT